MALPSPGAEEVLDRATSVLAAHDFDPAPLARLRRRLNARRTPADALIEGFRRAGSVEAFLGELVRAAGRSAAPATAPAE
jgi:hypothetical protein